MGVNRQEYKMSQQFTITVPAPAELSATPACALNKGAGTVNASCWLT